MRYLLSFILLILIFSFGCAHAPKEDLSKEKIVLVHGFARSNFAMWHLASELEKKGYLVQRVGYSSLNREVSDVKDEIFQKINSCCAKREGTVHFVGHSLGGLLIRSYLGEHKVANLGKVVIMGSPSKGTNAVNFMMDKWWFKFAGPTAIALKADGSKFLESLKKPTYPLGVIAGNKEDKDFEHVLNGPDDGLVSVESTKVEGMKDFVVINTSHTMMRYNAEVLDQTVNFLRNSNFKKEGF